MVRASIRTGVPVLSLLVLTPQLFSWSDKTKEALSPILPPEKLTSPTWILPLRNVPLVRITFLAVKDFPNWVFTPDTDCPSISNSVTVSWRRWRLGVCSITYFQYKEKAVLSHWARGLHIAGPLDRFSIRYWIMVWSVTIPDIPPKASISLTICPFAIPPMAGLQDICATNARFIVTSNTRFPRWAATTAASHPAWPAPTTIISYWFSIFSRENLM